MVRPPHSELRRIVSGGQTGVDRGALDAAIEFGLEHGGWCPKGRRAEDGTIPSRYELDETTSIDYQVRTELNVVDSDGTLILFRAQLLGGTLLTYRLARRHRKPCMRVDTESLADVADIMDWLRRHRIEVLNVAGPRESSVPGICEVARSLVMSLLTFPADPPGD
jgi:hypothetical protein